MKTINILKDPFVKFLRSLEKMGLRFDRYKVYNLLIENFISKEQAKKELKKEFHKLIKNRPFKVDYNLYEINKIIDEVLK